MAYLYHVEKRINDLLKGRTVPEVTHTSEDETHNDVCLLYAKTQLHLNPDDKWKWQFDPYRSYNGLYVVSFKSTDDQPLNIDYMSQSHYRKQFYVYIDLNKTESLNNVAVSWYG